MKNVEQEKKIRDEEQRIFKANLDLEGVLIDKIKSKILKGCQARMKIRIRKGIWVELRQMMILQVINLMIGYLNVGRNVKTIQLSLNNEQMM